MSEKAGSFLCYLLFSFEEETNKALNQTTSFPKRSYLPATYLKGVNFTADHKQTCAVNIKVPSDVKTKNYCGFCGIMNT